MANENGENKALVPVIQNYAVMQMDVQELAMVVAENLGGSQIDIFQLDRVKVPAAGGTMWQVPDLLAPKGYINTEELDGVILYFSDGNGYWDKPYNGEKNPPVCSSEDGLVGHSEVPGLGGDCAKCPLNQFGSEIKQDGTKGKGKACKNMRRLFIIREGSILPLMLVVPPSSLKEIRGVFLRLAGAGVPYWGVKARLTLDKAKSADGIEYSQIKLGMAGRLSPDEALRIKALKDAITPALQRVTIIDAAQDIREAEATA